MRFLYGSWSNNDCNNKAMCRTTTVADATLPTTLVRTIATKAIVTSPLLVLGGRQYSFYIYVFYKFYGMFSQFELKLIAQ